MWFLFHCNWANIAARNMRSAINTNGDFTWSVVHLICSWLLSATQYQLKHCALYRSLWPFAPLEIHLVALLVDAILIVWIYFLEFQPGNSEQQRWWLISWKMDPGYSVSRFPFHYSSPYSRIGRWDTIFRFESHFIIQLIYNKSKKRYTVYKTAW